MFVDVILPLAVPGVFTYGVPQGTPVAVGQRVTVPFGRGNKLYSGLVRSVHTNAPEHRKARPIGSVLDTKPIVREEQLRLWERIAQHYLCTLGEVMIAALPGQLVLSSETRLISTARTGNAVAWPQRSHVLLDALDQRHTITLKEAGDLLGLKDPLATVKGLVDEGLLMLEETLHDTWKPRVVTYVKLTSDASTERSLHEWFDRLERAPKQLGVLMRFVELSRCLSSAPREVERTKLIQASGTNAATLKQLIDKGVLETYAREADLPSPDRAGGPPPVLSAAQHTALEEIRTGFRERDVVLLQGVTSSGKTEVYTTLISDHLENDGQVLYLLPEIALTTQIIARLRQRFGDRIAVFHSRMAEHERTALWLRCIHGDPPPSIIIGARSALFMPFKDLRLVVVDEEHDPSYKQRDPAPRYNARDMAVILAGLHHAKVLLGSATPSLESQQNARSGKYGHVRLMVRYGDVVMPGIERVDLRDAQKRRTMRGHFSSTLIDRISAALKDRRQAIIFQNRRGYVPLWQCETCAWVPQCDHCDVSLTYHKQHHQLRCHYCGRQYRPPTTCGHCGSARLRMLGFGTERIEEELGELFPEARIARMDQDTTRGKHALERILTGFGQGVVDILVGTQMVTKGLDFDNVHVVGILNADALMRFPDFRAHERAFQLMAQVAGRCGRRVDAGQVVIQAQDVHHPVLDLVTRHDVDGMYDREIEHRRNHGYPPFTRLVELTLKHRSEEKVAATAMALADALRPRLGDRVLGPDTPMVAWVRDKHLRKLMIKLRRSAHSEEKNFVRETIDRIFAAPAHSSVQLVTDVDPM
ncbi:MAG: primosomal protein N' [Flavobacteriales bacterium]